MSMSPTAVFDLDGTLVDTAPDLIGTLDEILIREGCAPVGLEAGRNLVGQGVRALLEKGLAAERLRIDPVRFEQLYADFLARYEARISAESRPFPGVRQALKRLARDGWRLAVCTNKLEYLSRRLLAELDLLRGFAAVCGSDSFGARKPDPAALLGTIEKAGGRAECAVMVGDSRTDLDTARNAAIPIIGVSFGYTEVPMAELGPDRLISRFADLAEAAEGLVCARA